MSENETKPEGETVAEKAKDVAGDALDAGKKLLGGIGGALKKAGEAVVNTAENVTHKDLNKDGSVGGKHEEQEADKEGQ